MRGVLLLGIAAAGCGRVGFDAVGDGAVGDGDPDAVGMIRNCGAWSAPVLVPGLESETASAPTLTSDETIIYFDDDASSIRVATRTSRDAAFGPSTLVTGIQTGSFERDPDVLGSGTVLYFSRDNEVRVAFRMGTNPSTFTAATSVNGNPNTKNPDVSADGQSVRYDEVNVAVAEIRYDSGAGVWGSPTIPIYPALEPAEAVSLSADERTIVFESDRAGTYQTYISERAAKNLPFPAPTRIEEVAPFGASEPWISPDATRIYFSVNGPARVMQSDRTCQ